MASTWLASEEEKLERMIINGFCQKNRQGQVFRGLAQKLANLRLRRGSMSCVAFLRRKTVQPPRLLQQPGLDPEEMCSTPHLLVNLVKSTHIKREHLPKSLLVKPKRFHSAICILF